MIQLIFALLVGHAFADFVFQSDSMAKGKNRHRKTEPPPGAVYTPSWMYWLTAHALVHGGTVALITGSVLFGVLETIAHWAIDFGKCENWYGIHVDQTLHLLCKLMWIILLVTHGS